MEDRETGYSRAETIPTGRRVEAKVKWFNATKGFGFVALSDGSKDAFLPMAILRRAGYDEAREGASIVCEVGIGAKGPLVLNVLNIDNSAAATGERRAATRAMASSRRMAAARTSSSMSRRCGAAASARSIPVSASGSTPSTARRGWKPTGSP